MTDDPLRYFSHTMIPNPNIPPEYNILSSAISNCSGPVVQQVITEHPHMVNFKAWHGQTPLHRACLGGNLEITAMLLRAGANPNEGNDYDETPMHYSAKRGVLHVFHLLIQYGGDVRAVDKNGRGMVHHAAETGCVYMLHYLSAVHGQSLTELDSKQQSPILITVKFGQMDSFKYLLRKGRSNLNQADQDGNTPIHITAMEGYSHMTWLILQETGTKILNLTNNDGLTPAQIAEQRDKPGHKELKPILKYYQQNPNLRPKGPILRWYWYLTMPAVCYAIAVLAANIIGDRYQGLVVFGGLGAVLFFLKNQLHRLLDLSRWPNPIHAGTFAAGLGHTTFFWFVVLMPAMSQYTSLLVVTPLYAALLYYVYYKVLFSDPGSVTQSCLDEKTLKPLTIADLCVPGKQFDQFCMYCEIVRPPKTKHCRLCNQCFKDLDHHCLFLLQCIAVRNHRHFIYFLTLTIFAMVLFLLLSALHFYETFSGNSVMDLAWSLFHSNAWHLSLLALNAVSVFWGVNLVLYQLRLIANGFTTFYQPSEKVDVLSFVEKCMNVLYFFMGRKPFVKNPFSDSTMHV